MTISPTTFLTAAAPPATGAPAPVPAAATPAPADAVSLSGAPASVPHPYKGHHDRTATFDQSEVQWMRDQIRGFIRDLPAMTDPRSARGVRQALDTILRDMKREEAHTLDSAYSQLYSVRLKMDRVRESDDPSAALRREQMDAPIPNFGAVKPGVLYRGSQPSTTTLRWLADRGVRTVVSLRMPKVEDEYGVIDFTPDQEAAACASAGLRSITIPMPDGGEPGPGQMEQFLRIVQDPANWPVYVHCGEGVGRTGIACGVYERTQGRPIDPVLRDAARFRLDGHSPNERRQVEYIRNYPVAPPPSDGEWRIATC